MGRLRLSEGAMTIRIVPLPALDSPLWRMGLRHMQVAHAIACAFLVFQR